jgi:putative ABC transport system permease protein
MEVPSPKKIGFRYFYRKRVRTFVAIFVIALSVGIVISSSLLISHSITEVNKLGNLAGADLVVIPKGSKHAYEGLMLVGEPSTFFMEDSILSEIQNMDHVKQATPHLYMITLSESFGCCGLSNTEVVGIDPETDFVFKNFLPDEFVLKTGECILPFTVPGNPGQTIPLFGKSFTIAYNLPYTGTPLDYFIVIRLDDMRDVLKSNPDVKIDYSTLISAVLIKVDDPIYIDLLRAKITHAEDVEVITQDTLVASALRALQSTVSVFKIAIPVVIAFSALSMGGVMLAGMGERKREIGLLKAIGAYDSYILQIFLVEGFLNVITGWIIGLGVGYLMYMFLSSSPGIQITTEIELREFLEVSGTGLAIALVLGMMPALYSYFVSKKEMITRIVRE